MEAKTMEAGEFRTGQRNSWNKAASGWDKWAEQMLEWTGAAGISNIEFIESEASKLDFPAASFDAAVSRWGIIFEPEAEASWNRVSSGAIAVSER